MSPDLLGCADGSAIGSDKGVQIPIKRKHSKELPGKVAPKVAPKFRGFDQGTMVPLSSTC
jgi:hypothetical protein